MLLQISHRMHTEHRKWFSMTFLDLFVCVHQDFSGPFMSIFHVIPGLLNWVDIEQVRLSYSTEYGTQFIITLNNGSNRVWQWTTIMYVKAENMYTGQKCGNNLVYFAWLFMFPGSTPNCMTFQAWKIWILNSMMFRDFPGSVCTLLITEFRKCLEEKRKSGRESTVCATDWRLPAGII